MGFLLRSQGMAVAALALAFSVFLSRILGLVRDKIISYYFGAGAEADVYFTAFVVPDFLNYLLAGGYFSITLVPLLASAFLKDEQDGWRFFSAATSWAFVSISLLTAIAWVFAPTIASLIAPGFSEENTLRLAHFLRIILPAQIFFLPGACFSALLYLRKQFTVPALSPLIYNFSIILGGVASFYLFPEKGMEGFCWGVLAGAFLGSLLLPAFAAKLGGLNFTPLLLHKGMKTLVLLALPLMLGQSIVALDEQFVRIFGSLTGEGGVSLLNYARRIMLVPVGVVAQAAGVASFPFLTALAASRNTAEFNKTLNTATANTLLLALPLSLWICVSAEPIMRLIFQQGSFTASDSRTSGLLLSMMMLGVGFWVVQQIIGRAFYAYQNTLTPALMGSLATALTLPVYWFGAKNLGAFGVALAGTFGIGLYTLFITFAWHKRFGGDALKGLGKQTLLCLIFCLPASLIAFLVMGFVDKHFVDSPLLGAFWSLSASGLIFGVVYLASAYKLKPELCVPFLMFWDKVMKKV